MSNFLQHLLIFITTTFSLSMAKPTLPYKFSTTALASLGINPSLVTGSGVGVDRAVKLYSKNSGKFIRINSNSVDGSGNRSDPNAQLVLESAGFKAQVRIKSSDGSRYLCMSGHGSLIVENKRLGQSLVRCVFFQIHHRKGYTVYRSKSNSIWYLGVRRNGSPKSAKKTSFKQRATHFLEY